MGGDDVFKSLIHYERCIDPLSFPRAGRNWFVVDSGHVPVLLSAPHACQHEREGSVKMGEEYTAALALHIAAQTGCHVIATTRKTHEDPNWLPDGEYKNAIRQIVANHCIRLVIDIHGMTNRHHMGVALGTINGRSIPDSEVIAPFIQQDFQLTAPADIPEPLNFTPGVPLPAGEGAERCWRTLVVNHALFTGGAKNHTVTRFVCEELSVRSVQVEIAAVNRIVHRPASSDWPYEYLGNRNGILRMVNALSELVSAHDC